MIEYFIGYGASTNASFRSHEPYDDEWIPWEDDPDATEEEVHAALDRPENGAPPNLTRGLSEAIESCGFEWWIETRVAADDTGAPNG